MAEHVNNSQSGILWFQWVGLNVGLVHNVMSVLSSTQPVQWNVVACYLEKAFSPTCYRRCYRTT